MRWVVVWSLKRGIIDPPEPADDTSQRLLQTDYSFTRFERDPSLTMEQWWAEEGARSGYVKRRVA
jgi:hypothetical protein